MTDNTAAIVRAAAGEVVHRMLEVPSARGDVARAPRASATSS